MKSDDHSSQLSHATRRGNRLYETFTLQLLHSQPTSDIVSILKHLTEECDTQIIAHRARTLEVMLHACFNKQSMKLVLPRPIGLIL